MTPHEQAVVDLLRRDLFDARERTSKLVKALDSDKSEMYAAGLAQEAEIAELVEALEITARKLRGPDGRPCFCDDYDERRRAGFNHAEKCVLARAALAAAKHGCTRGEHE